MNVHDDETRIALTENDTLVDLHVQQTARERTVGNIYCGVVSQLNPALQAAFIDYGAPRHGFLALSDVNAAQLDRPGPGGAGEEKPDVPVERTRPGVQDLLVEGQTLMVQVTKESTGQKGAALTTHLRLPGRHAVLELGEGRGSRRPPQDETLQAQLDVLTRVAGERFGVILRTAGRDSSLEDLKTDVLQLGKDFAEIEKTFAKRKQPGLIHQEVTAAIRVLRDSFGPAVQEVWVDSAEMFQEMLAYFKREFPRHQKRLKLYVGESDLFDAYAIEKQVASLGSNRVGLPSGGSIILESTEALVSVDVNSGRARQMGDPESTALRTNLEAAEETARQLRLRNLGGLVVIDFIDMSKLAHREKVAARFRDCLRNDRARTSVGSISSFGLLEMSRQRIDQTLTRGLQERCQVCQGKGFVPTASAQAHEVLRRLREQAAAVAADRPSLSAEEASEKRYVRCTLNLEQASYLLNEKRDFLQDLEREFDVHVIIEGDAQHGAGVPPLFSTQKNAAPDASSRSAAGSPPSRSRRRGGRQGSLRSSETPSSSSTQWEASEASSSADRRRSADSRRSTTAPDEDLSLADTYWEEREPAPRRPRRSTTSSRSRAPSEANGRSDGRSDARRSGARSSEARPSEARSAGSRHAETGRPPSRAPGRTTSPAGHPAAKGHASTRLDPPMLAREMLSLRSKPARTFFADPTLADDHPASSVLFASLHGVMSHSGEADLHADHLTPDPADRRRAPSFFHERALQAEADTVIYASAHRDQAQPSF